MDDGRKTEPELRSKSAPSRIPPKKPRAGVTRTKLDNLFDTSANGVCVIDKDSNILRVNEMFSILSGVGESEALGKKCYDVFPCSLRHSPACTLERVLAGAEEIECRVKRKDSDGAKISLTLRATPFRDSTGELVGVVEDFKELSSAGPRKKQIPDNKTKEKSPRAQRELQDTLEQLQIVEEELRHQNREILLSRESAEKERLRYRNLFEFAPDGYLVTDIAGNIYEANRNATAMLNVTWDFLKDKPLILFLTKEDREAFHTQLARVMESERIEGWEVRLQPRKSKSISALLTLAVARDPEGTPTSLRWIIHNISKRKRMEEALRESEGKYRGIFENSAVGIFTVDLAGNYTSCNPAGLTISDFSAEDIIGASFREHVARESWDFVEKEYNRLFLTGTPIRNFQHDIITRKGERRTIESDVCLLKKGRRIVGFQGTAIDITERKLADDALRTSHRFLQIANRHGEMISLLNEFLSEVKSFTHCEAAGIRILDEQRNITCQVYDGFSKEFYELESPSYIKSGACMCMNIMMGTVDPAMPHYTEGGSFYIDCIARFQEMPAQEQLDGSRILCVKLGCETLATVPIRVGGRILGLIHVADPRKNRISLRTVTILESAAMQLGAAIVRIQMNETVSNALRVSQRRAEETSALLRSSRAILEYQEFDDSARAILDSCKALIGAEIGFIILLSEDGKRNEIAVLDRGNLPCSVDVRLPLPTRGLFSEAYNSLKPIFENRFVESEWSGFLPSGHARIDNVLLAPLLLGGKPVGLIGLANKTSGFDVEDVRLAAAFAGQAAIALRNSLHMDALCRSENRYRNLSEKLEAMVREQVTKLRQAESLASIGQMVSVVAHEIRNPLQSIRMGVGSIREQMEEDKDKVEILDEIDYGVGLLVNTVNELLDYSKPVNLEFSPRPLHEIVNHALNLVKDRLSNVSVRRELKRANKKIFVDADKMTRVISNLISNAADAMPNGGELKICSKLSQSSSGGVLRLWVSDTGCGIPEEDLGRIQEPFVTTKTQGTGLGIPVCKKIVEAHNGRLNIYSKVNEGTTVEIMIPIRNTQ